jgi:hypothetical protein
VRPKLIPAWLLCAIAWLGASAEARDLNLFEWSATAPIVAEGVVVGDVGKYTMVHLEIVFRGGLEAPRDVLVDVRESNRSRKYELHRKALHLEIDRIYLVLLEPSRRGRRENGEPVYSLVRGVEGARLLPAEGYEPILSAMREFVSIQDGRSDSLTWSRFSEMLEGGNPILIETALQQFVKFRRGDPELSLSVRPLLDHPSRTIRASAAELIGQIVLMHGAESVPEEATLRAELFSAARRDPDVSVRVAACRAMAGFEDRAVAAVLQEIADSDPEQEVRYAAETLLYERRQEAPGGPR